MSPPAKKRKTDFIRGGEATLKPVLAGIKASKYNNGGRVQKNTLPVFFVRESGDWATGKYRFLHPVNKKDRRYFVGSRGNPTTNYVVPCRCSNHKKYKCKAMCTVIPKNEN